MLPPDEPELRFEKGTGADCKSAVADNRGQSAFRRNRIVDRPGVVDRTTLRPIRVWPRFSKVFLFSFSFRHLTLPQGVVHCARHVKEASGSGPGALGERKG